MDTNAIMQLFTNCTALIVDDQANKKKYKICRIREAFEKKGISFITFEDIPPEAQWNSFKNLAFLIIDWNLNSPSGIALGNELIRQQQNSIMDFVEFVVERCFMPVFLFSQESTTPIKARFCERPKLKQALSRGQLVIRAKSGLKTQHVEKCIVDWCKNNPAAYTLKHIDCAIQNARNNLLQSLNSYDPQWPLVVYQTLIADNSAGIDDEFTDFLLDALVGRVVPLTFDTEIMTQAMKQKNAAELIELYSNAKIVTFSEQQSMAPHTGDVYVNESPGTPKGSAMYIINITAGCDLRKEKMLFLKGNPVDIGENNYDRTYGLLEKATSSLVPAFNGHACVEFKFSSYFSKRIREKYNEIQLDNGSRYKRIGRLIHPYITSMQERYSHYICRHGIMRHPEEAILISSKGKRR